MSDDRKFERDARAWLELGPTRAPKRAVEAALLTIETMSQQRYLPAPWRFPRLTMQTRFAVAAAVGLLAVGAGLLILRSPQSQVGQPSPSPTTAPSPSAAPGSDLDRRWLVFERQVTPTDGPGVFPPTSRLWAVRGDGSELHELASTLPNSQSPDIRFDGMSAFESSGFPFVDSGDGSRLWMASIDGDDPTFVEVPCDSDNPADCEEFNPAFSADGMRLAFIQHNLVTGDYVVGFRDRVQGAEPFAFTFLDSTRDRQRPSENGSRVQLGRPTLSPDGEQIAYQRTVLQDDVPVTSEIWVVDTNDTNNHLLPTPSASMYADPDWSPDGSLILLSNDSERFDPFYLSMSIYTIDPITGTLTELCSGRNCGANPSWTPDGSQILAWTAIGATPTWALMDAGGGEMRPINHDLDTFAAEGEGGFVIRLVP